MDSVNYLRGLLRSWWLVLLVAVAGGVGGVIVYASATPQYSTTLRLIVASNSPNSDEVSARSLSGLRATTISSVASTDPVVAAAIDEAGVSDASGVSVSSSVSDSFVTITVNGPSPTSIQAIAAVYPKILPEEVDKLAGSTGTSFNLNTLTPPGLPGDPFSPVWTKSIGLGIVAGLVLGLALAVLRETLNRTIRTSDELRQLTGLKILGTVPRDLPKQLIPATTHPRSARAEAYRQVRTTLLSASGERPLTVAVTSATLGEGKTSVSSNLAIVLSRAGHRVALVDADLRRPRVAAFFDLPDGVGLTDVLSGDVALADALVMRDDDRFAILPSGSIPANPSEALGSKAMEKVLALLADEFEFVIIDTPPVLPVTDALVLADSVDGVILVARLNYTTRDRVERAQGNVERVNAHLFGIVPNHAGKGSDSDYSYTYTAKGGGASGDDPSDVRSDADDSGRHRGSDGRTTLPVEATQPHDQHDSSKSL